jgi:hypothetical protein
MPAQKNLIPRHPAHERGAHLFMHCHLHRERAEAEQNTSDAPRRPGDARSASTPGTCGATICSRSGIGNFGNVKAAAVSAENFESIGGQNFETSAT